jgi:hypothetical protein
MNHECVQTISTDADCMYLEYLNNCVLDRAYPPLRLYENDSFVFINAADNHQISISKNHLEVNINGVKYTDKNEVIAVLDAEILCVNQSAAGGFSPNEGQVKLNSGNGLEPTYIWGGGIPVDTYQKITYDSPLSFSPSPTSEWPQNIITPTQDNFYDSANGSFLENTVLGQVNFWRIILDYSNKAANIAAGICVRINNPLSGFLEDAVVTLPRTSTDSTIVLTLPTIADQHSLPAPLGTGHGYFFSLNSTDNITIKVSSITRINYQKNIR